MQVDLMKTYRLNLSPDEFSTLGKALSQSTDPKAHKLNVAMQQMVVTQERESHERRLHCLESAIKACEESGE